MDELTARSVCVKNGSELLSYVDASAALLVLPSGEQLIISVGTASAKICVTRAVFGWRLPRVIASEQLSKWEGQYDQLPALQREAVRAWVLDGLVSLVSGFASVAELQLAWSVLRNPIEVGAVLAFHGQPGDAA
jgi:hypothetical protein